MPKSTSRVLSAIQTAVIIGAFFLFLWCLWKLPQEDSEHPDGFNFQCLASSYKILDDRNVSIKCKACPKCPPGQEPTPPCGSTIFKDTPINCTMCVTPRTFSEEHSSGTCKPCQNCSLRNTISPCTPKKNTQCGHCRQGYNCTRKHNFIKEIHALILNLSMRSVFCGTSTRFQWFPTTKAVKAGSRFQPEGSNSITTTNNATWVKPATLFPATKSILEENVVTSSESNIMATKMPLTSSFSDGIKKLLNILIALVVFVIVVLIFTSVIVTCMYWKRTNHSGRTHCGKNVEDSEENLSLLHDSTSQLDSEYHEGSAISDNIVDITSCETDADTGGLENLNLSEIPQDLEDLLVMRLDVSHGRPGREEYGWQKVGSAAGISQHELKLYRNEYLRQNGSPTKLLLEKLGSQGKTITYLLDVLQMSTVQLGSIPALIRHRVTKV